MTESTPVSSAGGSGGRRTALRVGIVAGGAVAAVGLLYGVAVATTGGNIPRNTEVLGIPIGGKSVEDARMHLSVALPERLPDAMTVVAGDKRLSRPTGELGLDVDLEATAEKAREGWASPFRAIKTLFGAGREVDPVPAVNTETLQTAVEEMNDEVSLGFVEGGLDFSTGVAKPIAPVPGRGLDDEAVAAALTDAFLAGDSEVAAAIVDVQPEIDQAAVDRALAGIGAKAMSGPVTITVAKNAVELTPAEFGPFLSTEPADGELRLVVDAEGLVDSLEDEVEDLGRPPRDAKFRFDEEEETVEIIPSRAGIVLDARVLGDKLADVLIGDGPRTVDAGARTQAPEFSTADAEALGISDKLSSFKTEYPYAAYRVTNIGRAAELINGSIVMPDEIWSLNKTVGERTVKNGFVRGYIIKNGQFIEDLGGGVSQSATTTYNAAFFAGLKDIEHHPHSLYISRYPAGREATVAWGSKDLRFQNDSGHPVYIQATHKVGSIEVSMWGTKVWDEIESISSPRRNIVSPKTVESEDPDCEEQSPVDGFDITITRVFIKDGEEVKRETYDTHYFPTDKIVCVEPGKGTKSPTPGSSSSPDPSPSRTPKPPKSTPTPKPEPSPSATPTTTSSAPPLPVGSGDDDSGRD
ncbi:VanW family protein [Sporichthya polymorpha]|uniref:VanW family protein n=1 Tax=Sporichthya polymorpha TaxID=35751 RepID=UPI00036113BA|nr:VanW family protein [Sporichthya polymorpha]